MKISVALAAFNGVKYIEKQLMSILEGLEYGDEIIVSDAGSTDGTLEIISQLMVDYPQLKLVRSMHCQLSSKSASINCNFEIAVRNCQNPVIVLSDQDDVWNSDRLEFVRKAHEDPSCVCAVIDGFLLDDCDRKNLRISDIRAIRTGFFTNLYQSWVVNSHSDEKRLKIFFLCQVMELLMIGGGIQCFN